jgi:hypothetical protein
MRQQKKQQMKDKRKLEMSKNNKNKLVEILKFSTILILFWVYVKTKEETIGYPEYLFYFLFLIIFFFCLLIYSKRTILEFNTIRDKIDQTIYIFFYILKNVIVSVFLSGIFLIPFNLYNKSYSKKNQIEIIKCKITGLSDYSKNSSFYYEYKGKEYIIYAHRKIMSDIYINKNHRNYLFVAKVKKGFLNTYIIESWDIVRK